MGKAERSRQSSRARIAGQAAAGRAGSRRRLLLAGVAVAGVVALVVAFIVVRLGQKPAASGPAVSSPRLAGLVTGVPPATFDAVGTGTATGMRPTRGQPLLSRGGKPVLVYVGGEFCPYCAAERWSIAAALSRFGTLSGFRFIHSAPADGYIPTITFRGSGYASRYLVFSPVEWYGEATDPRTPFGHVYLQRPTRQQAALFSRYGSGALPFLDAANQYLLPQTSFSPADLSGLSWAQVTAAMHNPSSRVGRDIIGAANHITAAICKLTRAQPSAVCTSPGVTAAARTLG